MKTENNTHIKNHAKEELIKKLEEFKEIIKKIEQQFNNDQEDILNSSINKEDEKFLTYINA